MAVDLTAPPSPPIAAAPHDADLPLVRVEQAPHPALVRLDAVVDECLAMPRPDADWDNTLLDLRRVRSAINRLELIFARQAARLRDVTNLDAEDPAQVIRLECQMTSYTANTAINVGTHEAALPATAEAFLGGRIGHPHLGLLAGVAKFAGERLPGRDFDDAPLVAKAERMSVYEFRKACYHAMHAMDAASAAMSSADDIESRRLRLSTVEGGGLSLYGYLDAEGGALVRAALEPLARSTGPMEHRGLEQRLGDALVELAGHRLDSGAIPQRGGQRSHIQVTTTLETLQGVAGAPGAELEYGGCIPTATVQRLACDSALSRVVLNSRSEVIDVGRSTRVVTSPMRRALVARDKGCRWPGCERPAPWTQAHHLLFWTAHLGPTRLPNLVLLCRRHHFLVHEGGHQLVRTEDGSVITVPPHPERHPPWPTE